MGSKALGQLFFPRLTCFSLFVFKSSVKPGERFKSWGNVRLCKGFQ